MTKAFHIGITLKPKHPFRKKKQQSLNLNETKAENILLPSCLAVNSDLLLPTRVRTAPPLLSNFRFRLPRHTRRWRVCRVGFPRAFRHVDALLDGVAVDGENLVCEG